MGWARNRTIKKPFKAMSGNNIEKLISPDKKIGVVKFNTERLIYRGKIREMGRGRGAVWSEGS